MVFNIRGMGLLKLPNKWLKMVDITIVFMGVSSWLINQQTYLGGPILYKLVYFLVLKVGNEGMTHSY